MFKTNFYYKVDPKAKLDEIFPNSIPVNSFIDKGRCAIGATYKEINDKSRSTIIVAPNISILLDKEASHPELRIVYGEIDYETVKAFLPVLLFGSKIMTTPEGMGKIMRAATELKVLEQVYNDWFLLLDEAHTFISEHYREDILKPFDYFWNFKRKSLLSATPYYFTDNKFYDLAHHKITFTGPLGTVRIVNARSVVGTLNYILKNANSIDGNLHIFYNSVTEIVRAIKNAELEDCIIYCAEDEAGKNMATLGEYSKFYVSQPKTGQYKKINFYTCKFFEGWDLYDEGATMILVTDAHKPHTMIGIGKGKQAFGRLRNDSSELIHLTNHNRQREIKTLEEFKADYLIEANMLLNQNKEKVAVYGDQRRDVIFDPRLKKFADIDKATKQATLNTLKLDQQINEAVNNEVYNHIDHIHQAWKDNYFDITVEEDNTLLETLTTIHRKSKATILKEDYDSLKDYQLRKQNGIVFTIGRTIEQEILARNPLAHKAFEYLNTEVMESLKYNVKKVQAKVIEKENKSSEIKLLQLLGLAFEISKFYTNKEIKAKLQQIYNTLNLLDDNGKPWVAKASDLTDKKWFDVSDTKQPNKKGKDEHGKRIVRASFSLKMAA